MQLAKVTVLYKKGNKNELGNYRPVSILPVFSKGLEKILLLQMTSFADNHNLVSSSQFGFRRQRSTELALLAQKEYILKNFENKKLTLGVFIDFDYLDHDLLFKKIEMYGFRGQLLLLISSYLSSRQQYVHINGHSSSIKSIRSGVPQGSILGPFLFNLYVNDIVNISRSTKFIIYADDTSLFFTGDTASDLIDTANDTLEKLAKWSKCNALKININKTKAVLFRPKNKQVDINKTICLNSSRIELVSSFKTLGIFFSETMSWDDHVNYIISKLSSIVGLIYRNKHIFPLKVKLLIYNSLFYSHINYGHLVWGTTTFINCKKIFILQKKVLRSICKVPLECPMDSLFTQLGVIKIFDLYRYRLCAKYMIEKNMHVHHLEYLANLTQKVHSYQTRILQPWQVPLFRTNYGHHTIAYTLPSILNHLHMHNIELDTLSVGTLRDMILSGQIGHD